MCRRPPYRLALLVTLLVAACTKHGDPGPPGVPAAQPAPPALAEAKASDAPLSVRVLGLRRTGPDELTLTMELVNTGGTGRAIALGTVFAADARDRGTLADMYLWDDSGLRKYYVLRDTTDRPRSSANVADLGAGESMRVWAAFPAPAAGVTTLTVCLPHLPPMPGVPVS